MEIKRIAHNILAFFFFGQIETKNLTKRKFIFELSFFTSWTITCEKCTRAHVQENKSIYLSIYMYLYMKTFLKTGVYLTITF